MSSLRAPVLALVVALVASAAEASPTVDTYSTRGSVAEAWFTRFVAHGTDADGAACGTLTTLFVSAHENVTRLSSTAPLPSKALYAGVSIRDTCAGVDLLFGDGYLPDATWTGAGTARASVVATISINDYVSGTSSPLDVSLEFTGTGPLEAGRERTHNIGGGMVYVSRSSGRGRLAEVTGTVRFLGSDVAAGANVWAVLGALSYGSVSIIRP